MRQNENIHSYYQELAKDYDSDRFANTYGSYIHQQEEKFLLKYFPEPSSSQQSTNMLRGIKFVDNYTDKENNRYYIRACSKI